MVVEWNFIFRSMVPYVLDRIILKLITGSHSKASCEILYLETSCLPLLNVITYCKKAVIPTH